VPRSWQPPADQDPLGFLSDGRTLVTVSHPDWYYGPIHLWDVDTGRLQASHFGSHDRFDRLFLDSRHDRLEAVQRTDDGSTPTYTFELWLFDARSAREVAHFIRHLPDDQFWWRTSPDGETVTFVARDNGQPQIEWYDVASGQLLQTMPSPAASMVFSPDGHRFAAQRSGAAGPGTITFSVWDVPSGREIASFTVPVTRSDDWDTPTAFSPDGELLLDYKTMIWEVGTGRQRFHLPHIYNACSTFSADGRSLIVEHRTKAESWISWHDLTTGEEQPGKRVSLQRSQRAGMGFAPAAPDGRFLLSLGSFSPPSPGHVTRQLARLPWLHGLADEKTQDRWFLIDEKSGREVAHGDELWCECNPQGTLVLTEDRQKRHLLWDVPKRKPLAWFLALAASLGLCVALLVRWRLRQQKSAGQKELAVARAAV
jgi:hypothetical protein